MSAPGALQPDQFGSYSEWHDAHFRPVRQAQYEQIKGYHAEDLGRAAAARKRGDREGAARALTAAARSRRMVAGWSHLKR
jgi:hypothetical protein